MLTSLATAHVGDIVAGIDVVPPLAGERTAPIEANYGLVLPTEEGYEWVCHEALTEPKAVRAPRYVRNPQGVWLATLSDVAQGRGGATLFRSADACAWDAVTGIPVGTQVAVATFDPSDPAHALAGSDTPGAANTIYASTDGGVSWTAAFPAVADRRFHSVGIDETGWATATNQAGTEAWFWREDAEGAWSETAVAVPDGLTGARFAVLDQAGSELWAVIDPLGGDTLLRSTDGGASFDVVSSELGPIQDGAIADGALWAVVDFGFGNLVVAPDGTTSAMPEGARPSFGLDVQDGQARFAVLSYLEDFVAQQGPTAGPIEGAGFPDDVSGPRDCPAGTEVADICAPLWPTLEPALRGFDGPPKKAGTGDTGLTTVPVDGTDRGACGCQPGPSAPPWAVIVAALLAWRRRR